MEKNSTLALGILWFAGLHDFDYLDTTPSSGDIALYFTQEEYDTSLESSN